MRMKAGMVSRSFCLIEIPAAALMAGEIIDAGADFLAVDLDDLVQYTCGVSRREKPTPADNPAVLRLVQEKIIMSG